MPNVFGFVLLSCSNFYYPSIRPSIFYTPFVLVRVSRDWRPCQHTFWPQAEKNTIKYRKVASISHCIHCMLQDINGIRSNPAQRGVLYAELTLPVFRSCSVGHDFTVPSAQQAHCNIHDGLWCCQRACAIYKIHKKRWYWDNGTGHTPCEHFSIRALKISCCSRGNRKSNHIG